MLARLLTNLRPMKWAARTVAILGVVVASFGFFATHVPQATAAHFTNWVLIQVPFDGTWNKNGWAPPSTHHYPFGGDWGVDYYAPAGRLGYFRISTSDGGATKYGVVANVASSCEGSTWAGVAYTFDTFDGSGNRGSYVTAHVNDAGYSLAKYQTVYDGTGIGWTAQWPQTACYDVANAEGVHWHIEMGQALHYSCYYPWAQNSPMYVGDTMGAIGSNATAFSQACW